jgi:hypothetical protein
MKFIEANGEWHLVAHTGLIIASLKSEVEVLALRAFCERYFTAPARLPEHFWVERHGERYCVTPLGGPGEKLAIVVSGPGVSRTIATAFELSPEP